VSKACSSGLQQSPVDLPSSPRLGDGATLAFDYHARPTSVSNTGHGVQVSFAEDTAPVATVDGVRLQLLQFHFHTPSEHAVAGTRRDAEVHLVHRDAAGALHVFATLLTAEAGAPPNPVLQQALELAPAAVGAVVPGGLINPVALLPPRGARSHYSYTGSLTTPPCSEAVSWCVFDRPLRVAPAQVLAFMRLVGEQRALALNARPLQALNGRAVRHSL
jgi:carbonic anhydrase